jgi:DNA-binding NtrC family response regulator
MFSKPYKLVIVEDDRDVSDMLLQIIEREYPSIFDIKVFHTPENAMEFMKSYDPQVVISDLRMPGQYGDCLLNEIRFQNSGIISILITGFPHFSGVAKAYRDGIHGFLIKPFGPHDIKMLLDPCVTLLDNWVTLFQQYSKS